MQCKIGKWLFASDQSGMGRTACYFLKRRLPSLSLLLLLVGLTGFAQVPGITISPSSELSDQKPGSVLLYNFFTSPVETEISVTNTNGSQATGVRFFFVNGATGAATQRLLTLNANQTTSLYASQIASGTRGYVLAVAVNAASGCPVSFNFLRGSAFTKLQTGHQSRLAAVAVAALYAGTLNGCAAGVVSAQLSFDGFSYNRLPRTVALDSLLSRADGNDTLLIVNRLSGSLLPSVAPIGVAAGLIVDDAESPYEFSSAINNCQLLSSLSDNFPRTTPRLSQIIPQGRSGWLSLFATNGASLSGAMINYNANVNAQAGAFSHGHNLHTLTLATSTTLDIPVAPLPTVAPEADTLPALLNVSAASYDGTQLAPDSLVASFLNNHSPAAQTLAGSRIVVRDSQGTEHEAPLFYIASNQLNYQMPAEAALGPATVFLKGAGANLALGHTELAAVAPGLFTANADGRDLAAALALCVTASGAQRFAPVARFELTQNRFVPVPLELMASGAAEEEVFLMLFGTGLRRRSTLSAVRVTLDELPAEVLYAGPAPGLAGLDQINLRVPRGLAGRGEVELRCAVDGAPANPVRVWIR